MKKQKLVTFIDLDHMSEREAVCVIPDGDIEKLDIEKFLLNNHFITKFDCVEIEKKDEQEKSLGLTIKVATVEHRRFVFSFNDNDEFLILD